jgi:hypothetical protein
LGRSLRGSDSDLRVGVELDHFAIEEVGEELGFLVQSCWLWSALLRALAVTILGAGSASRGRNSVNG